MAQFTPQKDLQCEEVKIRLNALRNENLRQHAVGLGLPHSVLARILVIRGLEELDRQQREHGYASIASMHQQ